MPDEDKLRVTTLQIPADKIQLLKTRATDEDYWIAHGIPRSPQSVH